MISDFTKPVLIAAIIAFLFNLFVSIFPQELWFFSLSTFNALLESARVLLQWTIDISASYIDWVFFKMLVQGTVELVMIGGVMWLVSIFVINYAKDAQ